MTFDFDEDMIRRALRANGWSESWSPDFWVHRDWFSKEANCAINTKQAFRSLLQRKNII